MTHALITSKLDLLKCVVCGAAWKWSGKFNSSHGHSSRYYHGLVAELQSHPSLSTHLFLLSVGVAPQLGMSHLGLFYY